MPKSVANALEEKNKLTEQDHTAFAAGFVTLKNSFKYLAIITPLLMTTEATDLLLSLRIKSNSFA